MHLLSGIEPEPQPEAEVRVYRGAKRDRLASRGGKSEEHRQFGSDFLLEEKLISFSKKPPAHNRDIVRNVSCFVLVRLNRP